MSCTVVVDIHVHVRSNNKYNYMYTHNYYGTGQVFDCTCTSNKSSGMCTCINDKPSASTAVYLGLITVQRRVYFKGSVVCFGWWRGRVSWAWPPVTQSQVIRSLHLREGWFQGG